MITADPERDMPDEVATYAARFNPEFIGLGGNLGELQKLWKELRVFVEKQDTNSSLGYLVSHTASVFVLDQIGSLIMTLPYGTSPVDMANDVKELWMKRSEILFRILLAVFVGLVIVVFVILQETLEDNDLLFLWVILPVISVLWIRLLIDAVNGN